MTKVRRGFTFFGFEFGNRRTPGLPLLFSSIGLASGWLRVEFVFIDRFTDAIGRCEPTQRMGGGGVVVQVGGGAWSPFGPITKNGEIVK